MDKINIFELVQNENYNKAVMYVYTAQETESDPTEHTVELTYNNPIPVRVMIRDLSFSSLAWKYYGQIAVGSKEIICELAYENILKACRKILIGDEEYTVYKDAQSSFGILKRRDYLVVILGKKQ